jgi:hypothetical protein
VARSGRDVAKDYPDVELSHMYVDNAAMQLVRAQAVRRDGHRQHVRRHPVGRSFHAHRFHRHAAVGVAGCQQQGHVRAVPRFGAGHRRQRHRQPAGDHCRCR